MRRWVCLYVLICAPFFTWAQTHPFLHFDQEVVDFGTVEHTDSVTVAFPFTVSGDQAIGLYTYGHDQVVGRFNEDSLLPGTRDTLFFKLADTLGGKFVKQVLVWTKGDFEPILLQIKGKRTLVPPKDSPIGIGVTAVKIYPSRVELKTVNTFETRRLWFGVSNWGPEPITLTGLSTPIPGLSLEHFPITLDPGEEQPISMVLQPGKLTLNYHSYKLNPDFKTTSGHTVDLPVTISGRISKMKEKEVIESGPRLQLTPEKLDLGPISMGKAQFIDLQISNPGKSELEINQVSAGGWVQYAGDQKIILASGQQKTIRLEVEAGQRAGEQRSSVCLRSNDALLENRCLTVTRTVLPDTLPSDQGDDSKPTTVVETAWIPRGPIAVNKVTQFIPELTSGQSDSVTFSIRNTSKEVISLRGFASISKEMQGSIRQPKLKPGEITTLKLVLTAPEKVKEGYYSGVAELDIHPQPDQPIKLMVSSRMKPFLDADFLSQAPRIEWIDSTINYGNVAPGHYHFAFRFRNVGKSPLIIKTAKSSCGCMWTKYPRTPIPPGGVGAIESGIDLTRRMGAQSKAITVQANDPLRKIHRLWVKCKVIPDPHHPRLSYAYDANTLDAETHTIVVGNLNPAAYAEGMIHIANRQSHPVRIELVNQLPAGIELTLEDYVIESRSKDSLPIRIHAAELSEGFFSQPIVFALSNPKKPSYPPQEVTFRVAGTVKPGTKEVSGPQLFFQKPRVQLDTMVRGTIVGKYSFTNTGTTPLLIHAVDSDKEISEVIFPTEPIPPGQTGEIYVKVDANRLGIWAQRFHVHTNERKQPAYIYLSAKVIHPDPQVNVKFN